MTRPTSRYTLDDRELVRIGLLSILVCVAFLILVILLEPRHEAPQPAPLGQSVGGGILK